MAHLRERNRCLQELGLRDPASEEDIKKAYRTAAFKYHPDKNPGTDTTCKFQQISAAYKYLIEGDAFLRRAREDEAEFSILRFLFPWLFEQLNTFRNRNPFFHYYDDTSDEDDDYHYNPNNTYTAHTTRGAYTAGGANNTRGAYTTWGAYTSGGANNTHGFYTSGGANNTRGAYTSGGANNTRGFNTSGGANNTRGAYTSGGANNTRGAYTSGGANNTGGTSGTSEHFTKNTNFTHTSTQHGQFFQEAQSKGKSAKKRNREAKRATKHAADRERSEPAKETTSNTSSQYRPTKAKSPTPDLSGKEQTDNSQSGTERESSQSPEKNHTSNNGEARKDYTEDQTNNKKSKKQLQMEQKQREKEMKEIAEDIQRQEREKKEKLEKKRAIQEEKERQEREARAKEEQEEAEKERKRLEELRRLMEKKDEEKKRKKREADKIKKLLDEFDSNTFMDENGDFKSTDPEMKNIIHCQDVNYLGNASKNVPRKKYETINGLKTEDLIKLQDVQSMEDQARPLKEKVQGSPNHFNLGPVGSQPQNAHSNHPDQQRNHHPPYHREHHQPQYQPPPQQFYNHPPPQQRQPTVQVPYWSSTQPPPPLHSINTNVPRASARSNYGYAPNKNNRVTSRIFSQQKFQGKI